MRKDLVITEPISDPNHSYMIGKVRPTLALHFYQSNKIYHSSTKDFLSLRPPPFPVHCSISTQCNTNGYGTGGAQKSYGWTIRQPSSYPQRVSVDCRQQQLKQLHSTKIYPKYMKVIIRNILHEVENNLKCPIKSTPK